MNTALSSIVKPKILLLSALSFVINSFCLVYAQSATPIIQWQKTIGGTENDMGSHSVIKTVDGGILTGGVVASRDGDGKGNHGGNDLIVMKMSSSGSVQWKKLLGGTQDERGTFVLQAKDGGFLVGGTTVSNNGDVSGNHGGFDIWIVKLTAAGVIQWQKTIGNKGDEELVSLRENSNGDVLLGGNASGTNTGIGSNPAVDYLLAKLSSAGTLLWQKTFGGSGTDRLNQMQATIDGGCISVGMTDSRDGQVTGFHGGYRDTWVIKVDAKGSLQWQRALGGSGDEFYCAVQATTINNMEGYTIAVRTNSNDGDISGNHGQFDIWVARLKSDGTTLWKNTFGGSDWEELGSIKPTGDGGFLLGATTKSNDGNVTGQHGNGDAWIVKIDLNGNLQWQRTLGGAASDEIMYFQQALDGGFIVNVFNQSSDADGIGFHGKVDVLLVKLDAQGRTQWHRSFGGSNEEWPLNRNSFPYDPLMTTFATAHDEYKLQAADGNYMFLTSTISNDGDVQGLHYNSRTGLRYDNWLVKVMPASVTAASLVGERNQTRLPEVVTEISAYPNPFTSRTTIRFTAQTSGITKIDLCDAEGRKVLTIFNAFVKSGIVYTVPLQHTALPKGIYFYTINNHKNHLTARLIKH